MKIIDSSVWIDFFNGYYCRETAFLEQLLAAEAVGVGDLVLVEVLHGFTSTKDYEAAKKHFTALPCFAMGGSQIVLKSAKRRL